MSLFQHTIIQKYLATQPNIDDAWQVFQSHFGDPIKQDNIRQSKEEQYQEGFLNDLFVSVFGYTLNPNAGYNLITEQKNQKNAKKADGAIILDQNSTPKIVAVIELKGMDTTDLNKIEQQAFNYKNSHNCAYVITSNFQKLRFYVQSNEQYLEFDLFKLSYDDFRLLYLCLALDNIRQDLPLKLKNESVIEEEKVTLRLYKDYSAFKKALYLDLVANNPSHDPVVLFTKTQKLLDRFLFILFAEDKNLLEPNFLFKLIEEWESLKALRVITPLYDRIKQYFGFLDVGHKDDKGEIFAYNGGLFRQDDRLNSLIISDDVLKTHLLSLIKYDFDSEIDVNILGHIFENSLNEIDELKAELAGETIAKSQTKRKKDGVFYTPKYITHYIVKQTVGALCERKKAELDIIDEYYYSDKKQQAKTQKKHLDKLHSYREWLLQLTICDPACGSGAFLNEALNFLIAEHAYIDELESKLFGGGLVFQEVRNHILENNLFGVDINQESVEIAKLSLWLRTAEPRRKLSNLNNNIQCGNSLIDDPAIAGDKAFDWHRAFPQVFDRGENSGFDVVIGNPPYIRTELMSVEDKKFYDENYQSPYKQYDIYVLFYEKGMQILKENGLLGYITPNKFYIADYGLKIREFLLKNYNLYRIADVSMMNVFSDASVYPTILFIKKAITENSTCLIFPNLKESNDLFLVEGIEIAQSTLQENSNYIINTNVKNKSVLEKIRQNSAEVGQLYSITRGFRPPKTELVINTQINNSYPFLDGTALSKAYNVNWNGKFVEYDTSRIDEAKPLDVFLQPKVMIRDIGLNFNAYYDNGKFLCLKTIYFIYGSGENELKFITTLLNSKLMNFYFKEMFSGMHISGGYLRFRKQFIEQLPIKQIPLSEQQPFIALADQMLSLNEQLQLIQSKFVRLLERKFEIEPSKALLNWQNLSFKEFTKELAKKKVKLSLADEVEWEEFFLAEQQKALSLQADIDSTDRTIDAKVYALYGLDEDEIALIESC